MMRVLSLSMLVPLLYLYLYIIHLPHHSTAQLPTISARSLDALLQNYAFQAFVRPRTGIPYHTQLPSSLPGIRVSAMRLRSGSLRTRGIHSYNEFQIPIGVVEQPYVERLVLVYHNLANSSSLYYPLPGYSYLTPVLGLLAYDGSNLSATDLPELDIRATDKPILIEFPDVRASPDGSSVPKCVYFDLYGSVEFDNVLSGNLCSTIQQGHFSIVVESTAPSPAPGVVDGLPTAVGGINGGGTGKAKYKVKVWITVWSFVGGFVLLLLLGLLLVWVKGVKHEKKLQQMEWMAEGDEVLQFTPIGSTKAPLAMGTRTRPLLENEYVP